MALFILKALGPTRGNGTWGIMFPDNFSKRSGQSLISSCPRRIVGLVCGADFGLAEAMLAVRKLLLASWITQIYTAQPPVILSATPESSGRFEDGAIGACRGISTRPGS